MPTRVILIFWFMSEVTVWTKRLLDATGSESRNVPIAWEGVERELGTQLPYEYKQLCEAFGCGEFSDFLHVLSVDESQVFDLLTRWRVLLNDAVMFGVGSDDTDPIFDPYRIYEPGKGGLIPWGSSRSADEFYWLVEPGAKGDWPILARVADSTNWRRFDISVPEFVVRVLTDPDFRPFGVSREIPQPFFTPVAI
ncbi:hypothetical protein ACFYW6_24920 [Streptomyces sp. NPDC002659]|uniref:hypothetical protein n=1 Tax=Streptomyces sp. NPDC002659 TaxID=3364656 RepID=UPI00368DF65B